MKCANCSNEGTHTIKIVTNIALGLEKELSFCSPGCLTMFIASSPESFMVCDACGRFVRAYAEDNPDFKQLSVINNKLLCLDCQHKLLFRYGQPLWQLRQKPPVAGISKEFHGNLLKENGFTALPNGRAVKKDDLIRLIPTITDLLQRKNKVIIKENANDSYTIWYAPR